MQAPTDVACSKECASTCHSTHLRTAALRAERMSFSSLLSDGNCVSRESPTTLHDHSPLNTLFLPSCCSSCSSDTKSQERPCCCKCRRTWRAAVVLPLAGQPTSRTRGIAVTEREQHTWAPPAQSTARVAVASLGLRSHRPSCDEGRATERLPASALAFPPSLSLSVLSLHCHCLRLPIARSCHCRCYVSFRCCLCPQVQATDGERFPSRQELQKRCRLRSRQVGRPEVGRWPATC